MCIWGKTRPTKVHHDRPADKPLKAYKVLSYETRNRSFTSPIKRTAWVRHQMSSKRSPLEVLRDEGVYCYKTLKSARERHRNYGRIIVELEIWGDIAEYAESQAYNYEARRPAGYRAQHARIVAFHPWSGQYAPYASEWRRRNMLRMVRSLRKRWPDRVKCDHRRLYDDSTCCDCGLELS